MLIWISLKPLPYKTTAPIRKIQKLLVEQEALIVKKKTTMIPELAWVDREYNVLNNDLI